MSFWHAGRVEWWCYASIELHPFSSLVPRRRSGEAWSFSAASAFEAPPFFCCCTSRADLPLCNFKSVKQYSTQFCKTATESRDSHYSIRTTTCDRGYNIATVKFPLRPCDLLENSSVTLTDCVIFTTTPSPNHLARLSDLWQSLNYEVNVNAWPEWKIPCDTVTVLWPQSRVVVRVCGSDWELDTMQKR